MERGPIKFCTVLQAGQTAVGRQAVLFATEQVICTEPRSQAVTVKTEQFSSFHRIQMVVGHFTRFTSFVLLRDVVEAVDRIQLFWMPMAICTVRPKPGERLDPVLRKTAAALYTGSRMVQGEHGHFNCFTNFALCPNVRTVCARAVGWFSIIRVLSMA